MVNITRYVTLDVTNSQAWGEEIADMLVLTGNAMDTFFKDMQDCPNFRENENILSIKKPRKSWNITDYKRVYEPYYQLSKNTVHIGFGLGKSQTLTPFSNFDVIIPVWWNSYNTTKHEFYIKMSEANIGNTINCLGGLLILNALHLCSSAYLSLHDEVSADRSTINHPHHILRELTRSKIGVSGYGGHYQIITKLFVFTFRLDETVGVHDPPLLDFVKEGRYLPSTHSM